jgi:Xaa-Pro aminopeptidase
MPLAGPAVVDGNATRARNALQVLDLGAVVSSRAEDVAYLVQPAAFLYRVIVEGRLAEVIILEDGDSPPLLLTMEAYVPYYRSVGVRAEPMPRLPEVLREVAERSLKPVGLPPQTPISLYQAVENAVGSERTRLADPLADARLCKAPSELEVMRRVAIISEAGMATILEECRQGIRECEAAAAGEQVMREMGADGLCFSTVVSSGPELGLMRELTSDRRMELGDWVLVDMGCQREGYNVEFARSCIVGTPTSEYVAAYRVVLGAQQAAIRRIRPGAAARDIDAVARDFITKAGYAQFCFQHITGHGIGTGVWEAPTIGPESDERLLEGMVVAVEPGVFLPGVGGIRIEDLVVVTESGVEPLTNFPVLSQAN